MTRYSYIKPWFEYGRGATFEHLDIPFTWLGHDDGWVWVGVRLECPQLVSIHGNISLKPLCLSQQGSCVYSKLFISRFLGFWHFIGRLACASCGIGNSEIEGLWECNATSTFEELLIYEVVSLISYVCFLSMSCIRKSMICAFSCHCILMM